MICSVFFPVFEPAELQYYRDFAWAGGRNNTAACCKAGKDATVALAICGLLGGNGKALSSCLATPNRYGRRANVANMHVDRISFANVMRQQAAGVRHAVNSQTAQ
jgi:hypothetical protein